MTNLLPLVCKRKRQNNRKPISEMYDGERARRKADRRSETPSGGGGRGTRRAAFSKIIFGPCVQIRYTCRYIRTSVK